MFYVCVSDVCVCLFVCMYLPQTVSLPLLIGVPSDFLWHACIVQVTRSLVVPPLSAINISAFEATVLGRVYIYNSGCLAVFYMKSSTF